jgi:hypothetical protein
MYKLFVSIQIIKLFSEIAIQFTGQSKYLFSYGLLLHAYSQTYNSRYPD